MAEWSGLLIAPKKEARGAESAEGAPPGKKANTDNAASDQRLLRQLESRMRTLEFEMQVTKFFNNDAQIICNMVDLQKHYDTQVKQIGGGHKLGSPHLHLFGSILSDIESFFTKGVSPDLQGFQFLAERLKLNIEVSKDPILIEEWCKVCGYSKTFDGKKTRLTLDLRGQVVVGSNADVARELFQKAKEEHELGEIHTHPLEVAFPLPARSKLMTLNHAFATILRGMGADGKQGRAPKGNLVRKIGGSNNRK